jgi:CPA1 family monovalent cation:H+ antiporter
MAQGPDVSTFLALVTVVVAVAIAVRQVRLPYEIALVLAGLVMAVIPGVPYVELTHTAILTVFLPVLLFHAAYNLELSDLRANITPVAILALPGVLGVACLVGLALHILAGLSWSSALLFGAIVGATDPISVLAIFHTVGAPARLTGIVSGESLFNDGMALVLFSLLLDAATGGHFNALSGLLTVLVVLFGSAVLGAVVGLLGARLLSHMDDALVEITITLMMAYGGFLLAEHVGLSGALETVVAGLLLGTRGERVMSAATRQQAHATWEFLDFLANSLLFLLMGLAVRPIVEHSGTYLGSHLWGTLLVALLAVLLARTAMVMLTGWVLALTRRPLAKGWRLVLVWAGLRGAVSLAAVLSLPEQLPDRELLLSLTFGVVLFTLLVQGLTMQPLLARLRLAGRAPA